VLFQEATLGAIIRDKQLKMKSLRPSCLQVVE